jgi:uncharacterized protein
MQSAFLNLEFILVPGNWSLVLEFVIFDLHTHQNSKFMHLINRRKFIRNTGLIGAGLAGAPLIAAATEKPIAALNEKGSMIYRTLGRTGIQLPIVSMGVMNASIPNLVKEAWNQGIRHFDTAWVYQNGNNELMVGKAMKELKVKRDELTIATKIVIDDIPDGPDKRMSVKKQFLNRFETSLKRLQMDYVDILYLHDVNNLDFLNSPGVLDAFAELRAQKKIRFAGFSTHSYWPELVNDAVKKNFYDVILLSFNYSMWQDETSITALKNAAASGIGLIAMKTQCQQDWYKQDLPSEMQKFYEGKIMHTALLKWVMKHDFITTAVPGFTTFQQLEEDIQVAYSITYSEEEKTFLENQKIQLALNSNCRFCGQCKPSCSKYADIPSLMRTHMYARAYGNTHMANYTMRQIKPGKGIDACNECTTCTAVCVHSVPIANRVDELKAMFT